MMMCSECSLIPVIVNHHSITVWVHIRILSQICEHLIRHLRHAAHRPIHLHIGHHTRHAKLLLVKSIHHAGVRWEWHPEAAVGPCTSCVCTALVRRQVLHQLLRVHMHELTLDHEGKTMHFTEVFLVTEGFQELLWTLWTLRIVCRFALKVAIFFLGFRKLRFQTLLFTLLLLVFYFELFHFLLEFTYLTHVLVSLLLEFRDLFFFISKLHFQAFVLVLGTLQIFLQLRHLTI